MKYLQTLIKSTLWLWCGVLLSTAFAQTDSTEVDEKHSLSSVKGEGLDEYVKAEQLRQAKKYPLAIPFYDKALAKEPNNLEYLYNKCLCYYGGRNYNAAEACFKKIISKKPNYIPAYDMLSNTYRQAKKFDQAVATLDKATEISEDPGEKFAFQFRAIDILFRRGRIEDAGEHIKKANAIFEDTPVPDLMYLEARYQNTVGNYEKAVELLTTLNQINGDESADIFDKNYYELGYAYFKLGKYPEAEQAFSKITKGSQFAIRAKEFTPEFLLRAAEGYYKVYEINVAKQLLQQITEMRNPFPDAEELKNEIENRAETDTLINKLHFRLDMDEKARSGKLEGDQDPRKFMLTTSQRLEIYGKLTKLYLLISNYDDALEYSRMYSAMNPKNPLILFYQALALHKVGDAIEAESLLLALSSTPQINRNARAMAAFALGIFQHETKQYQLAVQNLKKAAILSPSFSPASKYEIGRIAEKDPDSAMDEDIDTSSAEASSDEGEGE